MTVRHGAGKHGTGRRRLAVRPLAAVAAIAVAALLAACSSSSSGGSSSAGGAQAPEGTFAAGKGPIQLGSIASCTGPEASSLGGVCDAIKAWADSVNAAGGINGHPVNLTVMDDAGNPTTALQDAKQLVQQDHVIAIVGDWSLADQTIEKYIDGTGVPVVGGYPFIEMQTDPDYFPSGTTNAAGSYALFVQAKPAGGKIAVFYCAENAVCAQGVPGWRAAAVAAGTKVVYTASVSSTATSYTAQCLGAKSAGATALYIADNQSVTKTITDTCLQNGVHLTPISSDGSIAPSWTSDSAFNGTLIGEDDAPFFDTSTPATQAFRAALRKYAPSVIGTGLDNSNLTYMWAAGLLFQAAAKAAGLGANATSAQLKDGLYQLKDNTLGGFAPPLTFTKGQPTSVDCYFNIAIEGGKFTEPDGLTPTCVPAATLAPVDKALGV